MMSIQKHKIRILVCKKCGHEWVPKVEHPIKCPNPMCQSYKWNQSIKENMMEHLGVTEEELEEELKKIINDKLVDA